MGGLGVRGQHRARRHEAGGCTFTLPVRSGASFPQRLLLALFSCQKKQNSASQGGGGAVGVSKSRGAPGPMAAALGCFTFRNASVPQYLWPREDVGGFASASPQLRKGRGSGAAGTAFPPAVGLADPLAWSSMWGSSRDPQPPAFLHGGEAPLCRHEQLLPRYPELLRRAGRAAGRLMEALCRSKGSYLCQLPRRRMAAGINASSPLASPARRRRGRCAACLRMLN